MSFIRTVMPWFQAEEVHYLMANYIEMIANGSIGRMMLHLPPRTGKSQMASVALPAWWIGKFPSDKIITVSHKADLAQRFSRDVMRLMQIPEYGQIFPGVRLAKDAHAVGYWNVEDINNAYAKLPKGEYQAVGVTSGIAGSGFNLGIIDDPLSEQDKDSKIAKDRVWEWWGPGFYTRRQFDRSAIVLTMTRWALDDLAGRLLELSRSGGDQWEVVNIPAILNGETAKKIYMIAKNYPMLAEDGSISARKLEAGESLMPRRVPKHELERTRKNMTERDWQALYLGNPTEEEGAIIKRRYWRLWTSKDIPDFTYKFSTWDTAFEEHEKADYSAMTRWGVFEYKDREGRPSFGMMLLGRWKKRVESPDLPKVVTGLYAGTRRAISQMNLRTIAEQDAEKARLFTLLDHEGPGEREGTLEDAIWIENKASGINLIKELRRRRNPRLPIFPWTPPKGDRGKQHGKYARAQLSTLLFEQGSVWYPDMRWAESVIDECAKCRFDGSDESDDLPDTVVMAALIVRQRYLVEIETDIDEEEEAEQALMAQPNFRGYGVSV